MNYNILRVLPIYFINLIDISVKTKLLATICRSQRKILNRKSCKKIILMLQILIMIKSAKNLDYVIR